MTQALILANALAFCDSSVASQAAAELRAQHARIAELEQGKCLHQIAEPAAAQAVQAAVPGVCVLVPVDPTEEMEQAAADYLGECVKAWGLWKAMLAAAPAHPAEGGQDFATLHAQLLNFLGADDHMHATRLIAGHMAREHELTHPTQQGLEPVKLLAKDHANTRVDYSGLLGKVQREMKRSAPGYAEMIRQLQSHLQELGQRWYAGQTEVVDELLQLYCIESEARKDLAAKAKQGEQS